MTVKKTELLCQSDCVQIFKMHVNTSVWLKSDRIGFLIFELKHPDYSVDSHITPARLRPIRSDQILRSTQAWDFFPQWPWAGSRRTAAAASFLRNHCKKELHCASSVCNYHEHHIWNVQSCRFVSLFVRHLSRMLMQFVVAGDVKRSAGGVSVNTSWNGYSATYRPGVWHADRTIIRLSYQHVYSDNCSCLTE